MIMKFMINIYLGNLIKVYNKIYYCNEWIVIIFSYNVYLDMKFMIMLIMRKVCVIIFYIVLLNFCI